MILDLNVGRMLHDGEVQKNILSVLLGLTLSDDSQNIGCKSRITAQMIKYH